MARKIFGIAVLVSAGLAGFTCTGMAGTVWDLEGALGWGYDTSYMVTGFMNQHPRAAIAHNASPDKENIIKFYDEITGSQ